MTDQQPESAEVAISYETGDHGVKIIANLEHAEITIQHDWEPEGANEAITLVAALPGIMDAVAEAIAEQEEA